MPATAFTSNYFQVYGYEEISISALPLTSQTYTWDFRSTIVASAEAVPAPSPQIYNRQIIAWLYINIPNLSVRASSYSLAGDAAKIGSFAWLNQGNTYSGGFLNYKNQFLGNITCFDINDTIPSLEGLSNYSYFLLPSLPGLPADKLLISLSGGVADGSTVTAVWAMQRNAGFGTITNPVISYVGTQL